MRSLFVAGTDTGVGKTRVAVGIAALLRESGVDVGVMKPFAAGRPQRRGFRSGDAEALARAAGSSDPEELVNPQFFPLPASPYTAWRNLKTRPKVRPVLDAFARLSKVHDVVLVEGMGGVMTPILRNYSMADLARDIGAPALIVARTRIGTINHTIMTIDACRSHRIPTRGIILNAHERRGAYPAGELARDLESLTGVRVIGTVPRLGTVRSASLARVFRERLDTRALFG